jgi:hypothetical protein
MSIDKKKLIKSFSTAGNHFYITIEGKHNKFAYFLDISNIISSTDICKTFHNCTTIYEGDTTATDAFFLLTDVELKAGTPFDPDTDNYFYYFSITSSGGGSGSPTNITSTSLDVGGSGYSRTVNVKPQSTTSAISAANGLLDVKVDNSTIVKDGTGTLSSIGGGGEGQPTNITSTSLVVGGSGYARTVDTKPQADNSAISSNAGLSDVKIDNSTITKNNTTGVLSATGQPTNITSTDLDIGGSGYNRTANLKTQATDSPISKTNGLLSVKIDGTTIVKNETGTLSAVTSGTGQPTDITSTSLNIGGAAYARTADLKTQATTSAINATNGLLDVKVDATTITKNASTGVLSSTSQPTDITSTTLDIGGSGLSKTANLKTQASASSISSTNGLLDVKVDATTITKNATGVLSAVGGTVDDIPNIINIKFDKASTPSTILVWTDKTIGTKYEFKIRDINTGNTQPISNISQGSDGSYTLTMTSPVITPFLVVIMEKEPNYFTIGGSTSVIPKWITTGEPLQYKIGADGWWVNATSGTSITTNDVIKFRGIGRNSLFNDKVETNKWIINGTNVTLSGRLDSLLDYQNPPSTLGDYAFYGIFNGNVSITFGSSLIMPSITSLSSYSKMFLNCTNLLDAPQLPAMIMSESCYDNMFDTCTKLSVAPALPSTTLAKACYSYMFGACTSLSNAPTLPATQLATDCYVGMFYTCTTLQSAPGCDRYIPYQAAMSLMFYNCTALTTPMTYANIPAGWKT